ncbi:hypothetical protein BDP27DRAFT_1448811 [Rhodocollybia butyracea]|uniref:Uncharacterized protein n=1 Tax=Rhodocollybia butyracea TaxID=206335 RepID=A0A9P5PR07_9AGAR|nr:hypothetical protein BDP27DRAFT_1448811 [Rhodocollybia butyracea]
MPPKVRMQKVHIKPKPPSARKSSKASKSKPISQPPKASNQLNSAMTNPNIHRDRAKRWGTNPWIAEWFANAVEYLKTPQAQKDFEAWVAETYPPQEATRILEECKGGPNRPCGPSSTGNAKLFNSAAIELGVSNTAMIEYHSFTAEHKLVEPERTKPAACRRRGEPSSKWLVRRMESLLDGCQAPDVDWEEIRRIAISQLDETTYIYEAWHTDSEYFINGFTERAQSTVLTPQAIEATKNNMWLHDLQPKADAYRSRLHLLHFARAQWALAVSLFDELERRGLRKTAAIEAAYKTDPQLKWRMVGLAAMTVTYTFKIASRTSQVLSALPAFSKYFKRYRSLDQGLLHIEADYAYIRAHPFPRNAIDELIVKTCAGNRTLEFSLVQIKEHLRKFPKEALKFDDVAWREIGEYLVVTHFFDEFCSSLFGRRLHEAAAESKSMSDSSLDLVFSQVAFMSRSALEVHISPHFNSFHWNYGICRGIVEGMFSAWLKAIFNPRLTDEFVRYHVHQKMHHQYMTVDAGHNLNMCLDKSWFEADAWLMTNAMKLDSNSLSATVPDSIAGKGTVARMFGLYDVEDKNRPSWGNKMKLLQRIKAKARVARIEPEQKKSEPQPSLLVASPLDSAVQSGHAYNAENLGMAKEKSKTRPSVMIIDEPEESRSSKKELDDKENLQDDEDVPLPEFLPANFKLPKKVHKAMERVGFDIVQTAGSSVRFDPPAKTARPITFHRPHPDSLLSPFLIKWIGGRLNRCYGWTTATFLLAPSSE